MSYLLSKNREAGGKENGHFAPWFIEGDIGIFGFGYFLDRFFRFLCPKTSVFRFWYSLRFANFPPLWFSVFAKNTNGFSDLTSDAVFGFSYLTYLGSGFSSIWAAITRLQ